MTSMVEGNGDAIHRHHAQPLPLVHQIRQAAEVLDKLSPVKHVAPVRKSQVQHAVAEMLAAMLAHSVAVDEPRWGG